MSLTPATNKQIPDHAILDFYNKQTYLGNQFIYCLNTEILQTTEYPLVLIQNPPVSANAFPSGNQALFFNFTKLVCLTASQNAVLRLYLNPTFSAAGSAASAVQARPANATTSIATVTTGPTVSVNGSLVGALSATPGNSDAVQFMVILDPGQNLLATVQTSSNTTFIAPTFGWYQL